MTGKRTESFRDKSRPERSPSLVLLDNVRTWVMSSPAHHYTDADASAISSPRFDLDDVTPEVDGAELDVAREPPDVVLPVSSAPSSRSLPSSSYSPRKRRQMKRPINATMTTPSATANPTPATAPIDRPDVSECDKKRCDRDNKQKGEFCCFEGTTRHATKYPHKFVTENLVGSCVS